MNFVKIVFSILCILITTTPILAQTPTPPSGKKWQKIESMSDEFNGTSLNTSKWAINSPQWEGRRPAGIIIVNTRLNGDAVDVSSLPSGIYFLHTEKGTKTKFIVK